MIQYATIGTNDLAAAAAFYDALLGELGASRFIDSERIVFWATEPGAPMLAICKPHDGGSANPGNGMMVALRAPSRDDVDKLHARALDLGATNEGDPGERMEGAYGAYFRDLDGNKLAVFKLG